MAKQSGLGQRLYLGGYDLSGDVGASDNASTPTPLLTVQSIDKQAVERIPAQRSGLLPVKASSTDHDAADEARDQYQSFPASQDVTRRDK